MTIWKAETEPQIEKKRRFNTFIYKMFELLNTISYNKTHAMQSIY